MRLLLIRHGETDWNKHNLILGRTDIPLNQQGMMQTKKAVVELKQYVIRAIYSSPLERATVLSNMIAEDHDLINQMDDRLIEMDYGVFEGRKRDDTEYQNEKRNFFRAYPNGESYFQVVARVYSFLKDINDLYGKDDTVLIVTHNGICRIIANFFVDMTNEEFVLFHLHNCEIREFKL